MKIERVCAIAAVIGFVVILGTVGSCDCAVECKQYYSDVTLFKGIAVGMLLSLPYCVLKFKEMY